MRHARRGKPDEPAQARQLSLRGLDLVFDGVSFAYRGNEAPALRDVSLRVEAGSFTAVLGANGSGKSTLAKHVNGLLVPSAGSVSFGEWSTQDPERVMDIRRRVGMVFQNPDNQAVASIVRDDVAFGPENLGVPPDEIGQRVDEALATVAMGEHADDDIFSLSGGQKQRVAIAGALAMRPDVLVLDEPGAMLDVRGRRGITRVAHELNARGMTIVLVTHFMQDALGADHVVVLDSGRVALEGMPQDVFTDAGRLRALRLELPFSVQLAADLRARGIDVRSALDEEALEEELCRMAPDGAVAGADGLRQAAAGEASARGDAGHAPQADEVGGGTPVICGTRPSATSTGSGVERETERDAPAAIRFEGVGFAYDEGHDVLHDIDLDVPQGAFLGVIGHTGSGKSTLAQLMDALLVPTAGRVLVDGMDTAERSQRRSIRERVGLVFQYPESQLFASTVAEDLAFGPRNLGLADDEVQRRCRGALACVGLDYDALAQRSPFDLSGGQRRRVALAGVLAMEPRVLVLDEPAAGMDPQTAREIRGYLAELNEQGMSIVLVSHSMEEVAELCNDVLVLHEGSMLLHDSPAEVFCARNAALLRQVNLGVPRATKFALELSQHGLELEGPVLTPERLADALVGVLKGRGSDA